MRRFHPVDTFVRQRATVVNHAVRPARSQGGAPVAALLASVNETDTDVTSEKQREQKQEEKRRKKELDSQSRRQPQEAKRAMLGRGRLQKTTDLHEDKNTSTESTNKESEEGKEEDQEKDQGKGHFQDQHNSRVDVHDHEWFKLGEVARQMKGGGESVRRHNSESQSACDGEDLAQEL